MTALWSERGRRNATESISEAGTASSSTSRNVHSADPFSPYIPRQVCSRRAEHSEKRAEQWSFGCKQNPFKTGGGFEGRCSKHKCRTCIISCVKTPSETRDGARKTKGQRAEMRRKKEKKCKTRNVSLINQHNSADWLKFQNKTEKISFNKMFFIKSNMW